MIASAKRSESVSTQQNVWSLLHRLVVQQSRNRLERNLCRRRAQKITGQTMFKRPRIQFYPVRSPILARQISQSSSPRTHLLVSRTMIAMHPTLGGERAKKHEHPLNSPNCVLIINSAKEESLIVKKHDHFLTPPKSRTSQFYKRGKPCISMSGHLVTRLKQWHVYGY